MTSSEPPNCDQGLRDELLFGALWTGIGLHRCLLPTRRRSRHQPHSSIACRRSIVPLGGSMCSALPAVGHLSPRVACEAKADPLRGRP